MIQDWTFQGLVAGDHPMTDSDGDGTWTVTIPVPNGFTGYYTF